MTDKEMIERLRKRSSAVLESENTQENVKQLAKNNVWLLPVPYPEMIVLMNRLVLLILSLRKMFFSFKELAEAGSQIIDP